MTQSRGPLTVQAIAGSHVVIFGIDHDSNPAALQGLLGFGIERLDHTEGERTWLPNRIRFAGVTDPGSDWNPFQTFLWGDYTAKPGHVGMSTWIGPTVLTCFGPTWS